VRPEEVVEHLVVGPEEGSEEIYHLLVQRITWRKDIGRLKVDVNRGELEEVENRLWRVVEDEWNATRMNTAGTSSRRCRRGWPPSSGRRGGTPGSDPPTIPPGSPCVWCFFCQRGKTVFSWFFAFLLFPSLFFFACTLN